MKEAWDLINDCEQESDGFQSTITLSNVEKLMIEFAKLHVEAALEARDNLYETYYAEELKFTDSNKEFIRKSYPLTNIK